MTGAYKIIMIFLSALSLIFFILAVLHFAGKGPLLNLKYIMSPEEKREKLNKKQYYRQSAVVFAFLFVIMAMCSWYIAAGYEWLFYTIVSLCIVTLIYGVTSSVVLDRN